jgi:lysozyme
MRSPALLVLFASFWLTGCTSNSGVDVLQIAPSMETTSSIARPGAEVTHVSQASMTALAEGDEETSPALEQVALLMPAARPQSSSSGKIHPAHFSDAKPIDFGRVTPGHHAVHGVDVSRWQGQIDWERLRGQGANFAFIKATDGADHIDPMFMKNWNGAHRAGIRRGAYHFFYWCSYASAQADWFIRNVPKVEGALPPVLDVEWNHQSGCKQRLSRKKVLEKMQVFLDRLERHYGQRPIIYTAPDFYRDNLKDAFPNHPFWLRSVAAHPSKTYPGRDWVFWQYSGSGLSKGVKGRIDLNVFHGDEAEWWRWVGQVTG